MQARNRRSSATTDDVFWGVLGNWQPRIAWQPSREPTEARKESAPRAAGVIESESPHGQRQGVQKLNNQPLALRLMTDDLARIASIDVISPVQIDPRREIPLLSPKRLSTEGNPRERE